MREHYITATLQLLAAGTTPEVVFRGLETTLKAHDHTQLLRSILRGVQRRLAGRVSNTETRVTVSDMADAKKLEKEIAEYITALGGSGDVAPTVTVHEHCIGGVLVERGHQRIDASYRRALLDLYGRVTKA